MPDRLLAATAAVRAGAVVAVPTDTVYGLAADPRQEAARRALFDLKGRPEHLALPVLVADLRAALELTAPGAAGRRLTALAARFWPGALTVVVPVAPAAGLLLGGDGSTVGLRCPAHALLRRLLEGTGPLAVTSANRHGEPACTTAGEVRAVFAAQLGIELAEVLDGGVCDGEPSSVVSVVGPEPVLLRRGPVGLAELRAALAGEPPGDGGERLADER
jgi:L-threonylcarbamoyladenylate synthase